MKKAMLVAALALLPSLTWAANCGPIVNVPGVPLNTDKLQSSAQALSAQGAEVIYFVTGGTQNLDMDEKQLESSCPSLQNPNGGRKTSLVVLAVSPQSKKMGIYYGAAWKGALDMHYVRIKQEYMLPFFRSGDWSGGLVATADQIAKRIQASRDEAMHPAVSTVTNTVQAADLSGLWHALGWLIGLVALGFLLYGLYYLIRKRSEQDDETQGQQRAAVLWQNKADGMVRTYVDSGEKDAYKDRAVSEFDRLMGYEATNPKTDGLSAQTYSVLSNEYKRICGMLGSADPGTPSMKTEIAPPPVTQPVHRHGKVHGHSLRPGHAARYVGRTSEGSSGARSGTNIFAPVIINSEHTDTYTPPPAPEAHPAPSDDDTGGGSSSFESSSGSSSSDSDSGGSSSWDSGSSSDSSYDSGSSSSFDSGLDSGSSGGDFGGGGGSSDF